MIERLFKSTKPYILTECILIVGKEPYLLEKAYLFINQTKTQVTKIGNEWIEDYLLDRNYIKGYFYSRLYIDFGLFNEGLVDKEIELIGNSGNSQFQLSGVSIGKTRSLIGDESYQICQFSALDYKQIITSSVGRGKETKIKKRTRRTRYNNHHYFHSRPTYKMHVRRR